MANKDNAKDFLNSFYQAWQDATRTLDGGAAEDSYEGIGHGMNEFAPFGQNFTSGLMGGMDGAGGTGMYSPDHASSASNAWWEPETSGFGSPMHRLTRYAESDYLDSIPEIHSALDTYADEASSIDEEGMAVKIETGNAHIKKELDRLLHKRLEIDEELWGWSRDLVKYGDTFHELVIDPKHPEKGIQKLKPLPARTMWRAATKGGATLEFQQGMNGTDWTSIINDYVGPKAPGRMTSLVSKSGNIRFMPDFIIHTRIGGNRSPYYPYGMSILSTARRPAHQLRLMEDAMLVYRLTRAPERRIFYVDVGSAPPPKAEYLLERFRDKIKKKKVMNSQTGSVDERYNPLAVDEDFFIPVRGNQSGSRIDTLPGGQNLGEVDDAMYFRRRLYVALKIPPGYLEQDITAANNRLTLSSQDVRFAKTIYRIQKALAKAIRQVCVRHLLLIGVPPDQIDDLKVTLVPSSPWLEISQAEVIDARLSRASGAKQSGMYAHYDILTHICKHTHEEALIMLKRKREEDIDQARLEAYKAALALETQTAMSLPPQGVNAPSGMLPSQIKTGEGALSELEQAPASNAQQDSQEGFPPQSEQPESEIGEIPEAQPRTLVPSFFDRELNFEETN